MRRRDNSVGRRNWSRAVWSGAARGVARFAADGGSRTIGSIGDTGPLKPLSAADLDRIKRLLADLDNDQFTARQQAERELEKRGVQTEPALRKALEKPSSPEARRRVEQLLEKLHGPARTTAVMRQMRALEVLEHIGSPEARQLLRTLAGGPPEARLTREAKAALERLTHR